MKTPLPQALLKTPLVAAAAGVVLVLPACGSSSTAPAADTTDGVTAAAEPLAEEDEAIAAMLPESLRDKGTLTVAAAVYAPAVMVPEGGGEPTGWDIEITRQAAAILGLDVDFAIIPFDGVIPGLQAGRYDAATGEINVTPERTETVTFVVNHVSKDAVLLPASSELEDFADPSDFCGLSIGAALGSSEAATAQEIADGCPGGDTSVQTFQTQAQVNLALSQGRLDANIASGSQVAYSVDQSGGDFTIGTMDFAPEIQTGLALPNDDDVEATAAAFQAATDKLIETGELDRILEELNGGLGAVDSSEVVSGTS